MPKIREKSIGKSFLVVASSIFASRIFGLLRDVVVASTFGAGRLTDIFFVAFRIPNMLRRIFAEGAFSAAFTPLFAKKLKKSTVESFDFASKFFTFLLFSLIAVTVLGELFAPYIVKLIAPGFSRDDFSLTVNLVRIMFPYLLLVSLVAFFGGILNGFEHFFAPAFSTVLFNIALILCAVLLKDTVGIYALAIGVVVGGVLQILLQIVFLKREAFFPSIKFGVDKDVKKALKNILPGIFGFGVRQLSMLADTIIASFLAAGAISYLYYANRFVQLPLGVFAIGISQVLLPKLAKSFDDKDSFKISLVLGLKLCSFIIAPATFGLLLFGKPLVDVVFHRGKFGFEDLNATYLVLCGYGIGLLFYSFEKILVNAFYSLDDYGFPVKVGGVTLLFNVIFNLLFCFVLNLGAVGLALGTSLTSFLNVFLLIKRLEKKVPFLGEIFTEAVRYVIYSIPVGVIAFIGSKMYFLYGTSYFMKIAVIISTIVIAALSYFAVLFVAKDTIFCQLLRRR